MYLQSIGNKRTIINLANVAMIEDESDENGSKAVLTTTGGVELYRPGADASSPVPKS